MQILFLKDTYIRITPKDHSIPPIGVAFKGTIVEVEEGSYHGVVIDGYDTYYKDRNGWYYWSGRVQVIQSSDFSPAQPTLSEETAESIDIETDSLPSPDLEEKEIPAIVDSNELDTAVSEEQNNPTVKIEDQAKVEHETSTAIDPNEIDTSENVVPESFGTTSKPVQDNNSPAHSRSLQAKRPFNPKAADWWHQQLKIDRIFWETEQLTGKNLKILLVSGGINNNDPDLAGQSIQQQTFAEHAELYDPISTTAAKFIVGGGHQQIVGLAPDAQLYVANLLAADGSPTTIQSFAKAIEWGTSNGVDLIINLFAWKKADFNLHELIQMEELVNKLVQQNTLMVSAVGDSADHRHEARFPARFNNVLSIGAHGENRVRLEKSLKSNTIDVLAPSPIPIELVNSHNPLSDVTGQSAAVAGAAIGLLLEWLKHKGLDYKASGISETIRTAADKNNNSTQPHDMEYGFGVFDLGKVFEMMKREFQAR